MKERDVTHGGVVLTCTEAKLARGFSKRILFLPGAEICFAEHMKIAASILRRQLIQTS